MRRKLKWDRRQQSPLIDVYGRFSTCNIKNDNQACDDSLGALA